MPKKVEILRFGVGEVLKRTNPKTGRFEKTPEWAALRKDIDAGLERGAGMALRLTDERVKEISSRIAILRAIQRYIKKTGKPYLAQSQKDDAGVIFAVLCPARARK